MTHGQADARRRTGRPLTPAHRPSLPPETELRFKAHDEQRVLDAVAVLQVHRSRMVDRVARGDLTGVRVVGLGSEAISATLRTESLEWRHLLSVRHVSSLRELRKSFPQNRLILAQGLQMTSVFHYFGTQPEARLFVAGETLGDYRLAFSPVTMKIIDRTEVMLAGPEIDGLSSVIAVTDPACMAAAMAYWNAVLVTAFPARELRSDYELTDRQRQVVALLFADSTDAQIAGALGVSVRTVRADIAQLMAATGVRSRFALGRVVSP